MPLVPSYIKELKSYKPGKSILEAQREFGLKNFIKLASNENPYGPSPKSLIAIKKASYKVHRYPDASGLDLRTKLAEKYNLKIENVVLGSGSEGIMSTIMRTFLLKDDELISASNSFIGFKVLANASGCRTHWTSMKNNRYDLLEISNRINDYTKIIYIANPDNPMGTFIKRAEFDEFYKSVPDRVLIILDEAYFEYAQGFDEYPNSMNYRYDNVITLRTFSKAYGLAGVRVGYGFAHHSLIESLLKVKAPFEPSLLGQAAASAALGDNFFLETSIKMNRIGMKYLESEFIKIGIRFIASSTNFITTIWPTEKVANQITQRLLEKGVIVRQLTAFGSPNYIRISIGLEEENFKFIKTIKTVL